MFFLLSILPPSKESDDIGVVSVVYVLVPRYFLIPDHRNSY